MRVDKYTKILLTVIAVCLVWICVRDITSISPVSAQNPQEVVITGVKIEYQDAASGVTKTTTNIPICERTGKKGFYPIPPCN